MPYPQIKFTFTLLVYKTGILYHPYKLGFNLEFLSKLFYLRIKYPRLLKQPAVFDFKESKLLKKFECSLEWMLAICYHRGTLEQYKSNQTIQNIVAGINAADVIIAPIADNKMFITHSILKILNGASKTCLK